MKMKRLAVVMMMTATVLTLAGCQSKSPDTTKEEGTKTEESTQTKTETSDTEGLTVEDGILKVGMEIGYPPMEYMDKDGITPIGFDVDVSKAIGEELGLEVEFENTAWDGIFASLDSDRFDCVISAVSINEDRQAKYNLTKPYVANRVVLVVPKDSQIKTPEELEGKTAAVQTETTSDYYLKDLQTKGLGVEIAPYDQIILGFNDLKIGRVDAVVTDSVVAAYYMGTDADKFNTVWESDEAEPMGITLKKGNDVLTEKIEKAVDKLYETGKMAEISKKYFGKDVTEGVR